MAGPLGGIGSQQQLPIATSFQPGQNSAQSQQLRRPDDQRSPREDTVQLRGTQAAQTQRTESQDSTVVRASQNESSSRVALAEGSEQNQRRGSLVDLTI